MCKTGQHSGLLGELPELRYTAWFPTNTRNVVAFVLAHKSIVPWCILKQEAQRRLYEVVITVGN